MSVAGGAWVSDNLSGDVLSIVIDPANQAERLMTLAGVTKATVLERGRQLFLRSTGNLSTGGTAIDLTDQIHPDNRDMAVRAAKAIGLDVVGIDLITADITEGFRKVGGGICEVNAAPGFRMHVAPIEGAISSGPSVTSSPPPPALAVELRSLWAYLAYPTLRARRAPANLPHRGPRHFRAAFARAVR